MLFYILTVVFGVILDLVNHRTPFVNLLRKLFVLWLYVFLCFGYMTGSDWRDYEMEFMYFNNISDVRWTSEVGFTFLFLFLKKTLVDYWVVVGFLKCLYLYTLLRVVKVITSNWLSVVSLLITGSLSFILIDNPLRFMTALILVNLAMELCFNHRVWWALLLIVLSFFMHNASIFFVVLIPALLYSGKIVKWNRFVLVLIYLIVLIVSSNAVVIDAMRVFFISGVRAINEDVSYYAYYSAGGTSGFYTIGNFVGIFFFFVIIFTRDIIVNQFENGKLVYGMAVLNMIIGKFLVLIPTGFRLVIPFGIFYMIYMFYLIRTKNILRWVFVLYLAITFPRDMWNTYKYIPYSNSIPYIFSEHLDYDTRSMYNIEAYQNRTGKTYSGAYE